MMRAIIAVLTILLTLGCLLGCSGKEAAPKGVVLFLFDSSWSCKNLREQFMADFRNQINNYENTKVYVDLITESTVPRYPLVFEVPARKSSLEQFEEAYDKEREAIADAAIIELERLFKDYDKRLSTRQSKPSATNIIQTLSLTNLFAKDGLRDLKHKELIVFTDGIQQSPELDLMSPKVTESSLESAVSDLVKRGFVPNLHAVRIRMGGLGAGKSQEISTERLILIRRFWTLYFLQAGVVVNPADLDGTVL